ncbi:MAG: ATP-binding protein [Vicinamibacterales bacterium]
MTAHPSASDQEAARLAALRRYRILDTDPERQFDDLTMLASQICGTPIALITLIDADRQWFKSRVGVTETETARSIAFCDHAIRQPDVFVVTDALADARFSANPFVAGPAGFRFYAGAPIITDDGHALGTICVVDRIPRHLNDDQLRALEALRRQVLAQLELRRHLDELRTALEARDAAEAAQQELVRDLRTSLDNVEKISRLLPYSAGCWMNLIVPAEPAAIDRVTEGVMHVLHEHGVKDDDHHIELALQEALANAVRHGCRNDPSKQLQCIVTCDQEGEVGIVVRDPGPGFDPGTVPNPLEDANLFKPSGRGIYLINQLMDEVQFARGGSEIRMRKRPGRAGEEAPAGAGPRGTSTGESG